MKNTYSYNIHDIVTVASEGSFPNWNLSESMTEIKDPIILVTIGLPGALKSR